jgi:8-oxo-dGDP phosphatase
VTCHRWEAWTPSAGRAGSVGGEDKLVQWVVHGERPVYESRWVSLFLADVELPDGERFEHHLVKFDPVAATVVLDGRGNVLLLWRHRFATDTWNWEIPSGIVEPGETPVQAAAREVEEETGWRPGQLRELAYVQPIGGMTNAEHHVFLAESATRIGEPTDTHEADRVEWVSLSRIPEMIADREIVAGVAVVGLQTVLLDHSGASAGA